jgi:hypothetical protein
MSKPKRVRLEECCIDDASADSHTVWLVLAGATERGTKYEVELEVPTMAFAIHMSRLAWNAIHSTEDKAKLMRLKLGTEPSR